MHHATSPSVQPLQMQFLQKGVPGLVGGPAKATWTTTTQVTHQPILDKSVDRVERCGRIAVAEVLAPTTQIAIEFADQRGDGLPSPLRSGHFTHAIPQTRQRLSRREHVQVLAIAAMKVAVVAERETQKVEARPRFVQVDNARLLPIDRQTEAAFE